jgi:proteasome lid subunit RPN8/RPN11
MKQRKEDGDNKSTSASGKSGGEIAAEEQVSASVWKSAERTVRRAFPGPRDASALLRVAVDRAAFAELIAHAKESLEAEICGVLAGTVCEDEQGPFVHVGAAIRGAAASEGSTHVTFTQETWNSIHKSLERDHPKLQMVGWYHSHPGFGVEFSDMDLFIQKNFFPSPTQLALVIDPLSGAVAICINTPTGIQYVDRFWVDGREQPCQMPKKQIARESSSGSSTSAPVDPDAFRAMEARVGQLIQSLDDQRASYHRFLMFIGIMVCLGLIGCFAYTYYSQLRYRNQPPEGMSFAPIPIQLGDKTVLLGVAVTQWQVPEELNAVNLALERERRQAEEKAAKSATNTGGTNAVLKTNETKAPPK